MKGPPEKGAAHCPKLKQSWNKSVVSFHLITNSALTLDVFRSFHSHCRLIKLRKENNEKSKENLKNINLVRLYMKKNKIQI